MHKIHCATLVEPFAGPEISEEVEASASAEEEFAPGTGYSDSSVVVAERSPIVRLSIDYHSAFRVCPSITTHYSYKLHLQLTSAAANSPHNLTDS